MNYVQRIIHELNETILEVQDFPERVYEFATGIAEVKRSLIKLSPQVMQHIIKAIQYGSQYPETLHHWAADIYSFLIDDVYTRFKRPKRSANAEELFDWLYYAKYDTDRALLGAMKKARLSDMYNPNGYQNPKYVQLDDLKAEIQRILHEIIDLICSNNFDVNTITEILEKSANA